MTHAAYLLLILASAAGVLVVARRRLELNRARLLRAVAVTVPAMLAIDLAGCWRGWFHSDPRLSLAVLPGGVSLEEPFLLAFLVVVAVALAEGAARAVPEDG